MTETVAGITGNIVLTGETASVKNYVWHISTGIHGHLTLTGFAGLCSADASVIGVDGSLVLTGNAGYVVTDDFVIGQTGNLILTGNVSGIVTDDFVTGQTGNLSLTGNSAAVIANYILESASWSANLKTFSHSRYTNFDFNSLSGGYGCKNDGIYLLEGNTDNGTAIDCLLDLGKTDFQSPFLKRMTDAYLAIDADGGSIQLNLITENADTTYTVTSSQNLQTNKIQLGRGAVGRYWQAILKNVNGAAFVLDSIELNAEILNRKVRGAASQAVVVNPVPELGTCCNDIEMPFSWGDATPAKVVTVPAGKTVFKVQVVLQTVFNGATVGLTIGDSADTARLLGADNISLYDAATYEANPNYKYANQTDVNLYITVDGSNTQGSGVILLELKD